MTPCRLSSFDQQEQQNKNTDGTSVSSEDNTTLSVEKEEMRGMYFPSTSHNIPLQQTSINQHCSYDQVLSYIAMDSEQDDTTALLYPLSEHDMYQYDEYSLNTPHIGTLNSVNMGEYNHSYYNEVSVDEDLPDLLFEDDNITKQQQDTPSHITTKVIYEKKLENDLSSNIHVFQKPSTSSFHSEKTLSSDGKKLSNTSQRDDYTIESMDKNIIHSDRAAKKSKLDTSIYDPEQASTSKCGTLLYEKCMQKEERLTYTEVLNYINPYPIRISAIFNSIIKDKCVSVINKYISEASATIIGLKKGAVSKKNVLFKSTQEIEAIIDRKMESLSLLDRLMENFKLTTDIEIKNLSESIFPKNIIEETRINLKSEIASIIKEIRLSIDNKLIFPTPQHYNISEKTSNAIFITINRYADDFFNALATDQFCRSIIMKSLTDKDTNKVPLSVFNKIINFRDKIYYELNAVEHYYFKSISMVCRISNFESIIKSLPEISSRLVKHLDSFSEFISNELIENAIIISDSLNICQISKRQIAKFTSNIINETKNDYVRRLIVKKKLWMILDPTIIGGYIYI